VAVDPRRRRQGGAAIEQLQWGQDLRVVLGRIGLVALEEQVLGIEFAQPVLGERWPGAVSQ
jgi:hypothetical protein